MPQETLTFACPVCNTHLTVPVSLAGVVGPCPTCNTRIQAPALPAGYDAPMQPPAPQPTSGAVANPVPATASAAETRTGYRPEPRQLPARTEGKDPVGKPMPRSMRGDPEEAHERRRRPSALLRIFIPLLFLGTGAGLVFGILQFSNTRKVPAATKDIPQPALTEPAPRRPESRNELPPPPAEPDESAPVAPPTSDALTPPDLSSRPSSKSIAATNAIQVLEKFLSATSLIERLPLMEGTTPEIELQESCLAHALRPRRNIIQSIRSENPIERATDFFFEVDFSGAENGGEDRYEILVRQRGDQLPKVVTEPFLDLYGGRLDKFASKPDSKVGTFQVFVSAYPNCSDTRIPNYEKKLSLKLSSQRTGRGITTAYSGQFSAIAEMVKSGQSGFGWGSGQACTIVLLWNTKDNPEQPYLEASSIKSLTWNP